MVAIKLEWINSDNGDKHHDPDKRRTIRVQAMKAAAESRKLSGTWGKKNLRQPEIVRCDKNMSSSSSDGDSNEDSPPLNHSRSNKPQRNCVRARDVWKPNDKVIPIVRYLKSDGIPGTARLGASACSRLAQQVGRLPGTMPLPSFEGLSADIGISVLDLDELTGVATGQIAASILTKHQTSLDKLIVHRRQSYLFHVPARYGHSTCLDDAVRCVTNKAKRVLVPNYIAPKNGEQDIISLYGKALRSLQAAVDDSSDWTDPSILAAIEILSIYELLDSPSRSNAWENHVAGAARLIRARGPSRWKTEFEKALLASIISPIICEALRLFEPCFLDEEPWKEVIRSLINNTADHYSARGRGYMQLWCFGVELPRLMFDTYHAVMSPSSLTDEQVDELEARCREHKQGILDWTRDYDKYQSDIASDKAPLDVRIELYGAGLAMLISASRLLGALSPCERASEEVEALKYAELYLRVMREVEEKNKWASFYLQQKVIVADSILSSTEVWSQGLNRDEVKPRIIEKWRYEAWFNSLRGNRLRQNQQQDPKWVYREASPTWKSYTTSWNNPISTAWSPTTARFGIPVKAGN